MPRSAKISIGGYSGVPRSAKISIGGDSLESNTQSAKICLNFNFQGGYSGVKHSKYQDLPKFQFSGGGGTLE